MKLINFYLSRNILGWKEGTHTLEVKYRGSREELMQKIKELIEEQKEDEYA